MGLPRSAPRYTSITAGSAATPPGAPSAIFSPALSTMMRPREIHQRPHDVLDHQHGGAAGHQRPDERHRRRRLGRVEPGQELVEQQQPGRGGQRAGQLQPLAVDQRELARRAPRPGPPARRAPAAARPRPSRPAREPSWRPKRRPTRTFSSAVRPANGRTSWKVRAMPRAHTRCGREPARSRGRPGGSGRRRGRRAPAIRLKSVVLPEPFGPMMPTSSPSVEGEADVVDGPDAAEALADVLRPRAGASDGATVALNAWRTAAPDTRAGPWRTPWATPAPACRSATARTPPARSRCRRAGTSRAR